ncbi:MAG: pilin [Candidatus Andersenbacteria bacterium]
MADPVKPGTSFFEDGLTKAKNVDPTLGGVADGIETTLLENIINWLLSISAVLALLALVVGGMMYIISFGDEAKVKKAKSIIIYAITGLIVVGISFFIINTIKEFLTVKPPNP